MTILFFVLGLVAGSFGNVLIARLPKGGSILGRSKCPKCNRTLKVQELIPVLSFVFQQGKCSGCNKSISWVYPFVEITSGLLFLASYILVIPDSVGALLLALTLWLLLLISVIDAQTKTIPDALSIALIVVAVLSSHTGGLLSWTGPALGAGFFAAQWLISRGKWLGSGDILLGAGIGALLGNWWFMTVCLFWAYVTGALWAIALLIFKRAGRGTQIPFGPFLALGALITVFYGNYIIDFIFI